MSNPVFIISAEYTSFKQWPPDTAKNIYPSALVKSSHPEQIIEVYRFFSNNLIPGFSISIVADAHLDGHLLEQLVSFLFIPCYYGTNNRRIINLIGTDNELLAETKRKILESSQKQGIKNLVVNSPLTYESAANLEKRDNTSYLFTDTETLLEHYLLPVNFASINDRCFFLLDPQADLQKLNVAIRKADKELENKNPLLFSALSALDNQASENELFKRKLLAAEAELNNYKSHIEILRSSHQAKELQEYYDREYEVLPLWYKQFGHIIKVITGKRSFRSLFKNKIKKSAD